MPNKVVDVAYTLLQRHENTGDLSTHIVHRMVFHELGGWRIDFVYGVVSREKALEFLSKEPGFLSLLPRTIVDDILPVSLREYIVQYVLPTSWRLRFFQDETLLKKVTVLW